MSYRKSKVISPILTMGIALFFSSLVYAQPGMDYFNRGVKAAESGDYRSALKLFQKAREAGLDSAALDYDFGVTYYRLGQYEKAKNAFKKLVNMDNYKQLSHYNLGLIANKQNQKSEAIASFQLAIQAGDSEKIEALAREALERLGAKPGVAAKPVKKWAGLAAASFASDSNVAFVNDDLVGVTSNSDTSMILTVFAANWLRGNVDDGLRLFLRGYLQNYSTETDYNYTQYGAGIGKYHRLGNWQMRYSGYLDETYLGGSSYQRILTAEARGRKDISNNNQLRFRYKFNSIDATDSAYDYLGGTRHQFRAGLQKRNKTSRILGYYEYELNDREDFENPAGVTYTFKSYSPTRHTFRVTGWLDITRLWELRLDARHRTSTYNDDQILTAGGTELRKDTQTRLSARLSREIDRDMNLEMSYTVTRNDSSIDEESYDRNLASLGLSWKF